MGTRNQRRRITVRAFARDWIAERRKHGIESVNDEESRLNAYVLPVIGDLALAPKGVRARDIRGLVKLLRIQPGVQGNLLAPRTIRNIYGTVHRLFEDAVADEQIETSPCHLGRYDLP